MDYRARRAEALCLIELARHLGGLKKERDRQKEREREREREGGRGREKEREFIYLVLERGREKKTQWLPPARPSPQPRDVLWPRIEPATFYFGEQSPTH